VWRFPALLTAALLVAALGCERFVSDRPSGSGDAAAQVARGRYLVESVAMCADCHTPRLPGGEFDRTRWLLGSEIREQRGPGIILTSDIVDHSRRWTVEGMAGLLSTGRTPSGGVVPPPMPQYRMNVEDSTAVALYLKSLATQAP
jgi:mono/diheme cytochrome c family protein